MENYSISYALHLFVAFFQTCKMSERFNYFARLTVTVTQKKITKATLILSTQKKKKRKRERKNKNSIKCHILYHTYLTLGHYPIVYTHYKGLKYFQF